MTKVRGDGVCRYFFIALLCVVLVGCFSSNLGSAYHPSEHGKAPGDKGVVIIFVDSGIEQSIAYRVWIDDEGHGLIFPNSFTRVPAGPGVVNFRFWEQFAGNIFRDSMPDSYTALGTPFSFKPGIVRPIDVKPGEVKYIRIRKEFAEVFTACEEAKETTTICKKRQYKTVIEEVDGTVATADLSGMKESL
ncbi:MAG: hypothetical protein ACI9ON_004338 [Limisphaerales bacterium]|jgi:hypothetical protein